MSDLISRQAAIDALVGITMFETKHEIMQRVNASVQDEQGWLGAVAECLDEIEDLPSVQPESEEMLSGRVWDEWCTGCKEYDHERHCCPRFNRVIRTAIDDAQPEIVRCKDCKYFQTDKCYIHIERIWELTPEDYCSQGERDETD